MGSLQYSGQMQQRPAPADGNIFKKAGLQHYYNQAPHCNMIIQSWDMAFKDSDGSFALSCDKTELFSMAIGAYLDIICEVFNNQAIPRLINLNGDHFNSITDYPRMEHGDIEDEDIEKLANYIKEMTGVGILTPDSQLEDYVREAAHLPERLEDDTPAVPAQGGEKPVNARQRQQAKPQQQRSSTVDPGGEEDPDGVAEEDMQAVEEARKRLGRDP